MAVVGQVTHVRCKVMYRCVCARHCAVETDTQQGYRQRADNRQTNLGSYSIPTELMSLSHDGTSVQTTRRGSRLRYQCEIKYKQRTRSSSLGQRRHERYMDVSRKLLYGASGPTVSEDGSCRASDTCALQGYVQMCMRSTLCSGDRHTTGIPTKS